MEINPNTLPSIDDIQEAYQSLAAALNGLQMEQDRLIGSDYALQTQKAELIANGMVEGRNAEERKARLRQLLAQDYADLKDAQQRYLAAKIYYDKTNARVRMYEAIIGLAELHQPIIIQDTSMATLGDLLKKESNADG